MRNIDVGVRTDTLRKFLRSKDGISSPASHHHGISIAEKTVVRVIAGIDCGFSTLHRGFIVFMSESTKATPYRSIADTASQQLNTASARRL